MSQAEDLAAIDRYIKSAPAKTTDALAIRDEWTVWYDGLSWFAIQYSTEAYDHARNLRNEFNLANAVTAVEYNAAQQQIQSGATTEEMVGATRRNLSTGMYEEPLISSSTKTGIFLTLLAGMAVYAVAELATFHPKLFSRFLPK